MSSRNSFLRPRPTSSLCILRKSRGGPSFTARSWRNPATEVLIYSQELDRGAFAVEIATETTYGAFAFGFRRFCGQNTMSLTWPGRTSTDQSVHDSVSTPTDRPPIDTVDPDISFDSFDNFDSFDDFDSFDNFDDIHHDDSPDIDLGRSITQFQPPPGTIQIPDDGNPPVNTGPGPRLYDVWFATNRVPVDPHRPSRGFSSKRALTTSFGRCSVVIPSCHVFGSTGSSWWQRWTRCTDDRLRIHRIFKFDAPTFWLSVQDELRRCNPSERQALVYIHGYNATFAAAIIRTAQIAFDLRIPGIAASFTWPSRGRPGQ